MTNEEIDFVIETYTDRIEQLERQVNYYRDLFNNMANQQEIISSYLYDNYGIFVEDILAEDEYEDC